MATREPDTQAAAGDSTSRVDEFRVTRRSRITGRKRATRPTDGSDVRHLDTFADRASAAAFVDGLAERGVDVTGMQIVASDVRLVEVVRGSLSWTSATLRGASTGLPIGMLVGLLLGLFDPIAPLTSALFGALFGAIFGLLVGALLGAARRALRGRDGFESTAVLAAGRYDVLADPELARSLARDTSR